MHAPGRNTSGVVVVKTRQVCPWSVRPGMVLRGRMNSGASGHEVGCAPCGLQHSIGSHFISSQCIQGALMQNAMSQKRAGKVGWGVGVWREGEGGGDGRGDMRLDGWEKEQLAYATGLFQRFPQLTCLCHSKGLNIAFPVRAEEEMGSEAGLSVRSCVR